MTLKNILMNSLKCKLKKISVILSFFICSHSALFAKEVSQKDDAALSYIRDFCFEITRYNATGMTVITDCIPLASSLKTASSLLLQHKVKDSVQNSLYICEYYLPQKRGIIDCSLTPENLYVVADSVLQETERQFDWIDMLLQGLTAHNPALAEKYDINDGSRILEMLEGGSGRGIDGLEEEKTDQSLPPEFVYTRSSGDLRRFSYDGEQFLSWKEGDDTVLVNSYGDKLIRKKFDSLYRLIKNERLKLAGSARNSSVENVISYEYFPDSSAVESLLEENFTEKKRVENHFDSKGRRISLLESHYEEREVKSKKKKKADSKAETQTLLLNDKKALFSYDEKDRLKEEEIFTWTYKKNLNDKYVTIKRSIKNVYDYSSVTEENKNPPDLKFFEDGELHMERKYTSSLNYSEKLYFDGGFSVEVLYEDGLKQTEIIYLNDVEYRRRSFEY